MQDGERVVTTERINWRPANLDEARLNHATDLALRIPPAQLMMRRALWESWAACDPAAYGDDGEMQYNRAPAIDFLRDPPDVIVGRMAVHNERRMHEAVSTVYFQPMATAPREADYVRLLLDNHVQVLAHYMTQAPEDHPPIDAGWYYWSGHDFRPVGAGVDRDGKRRQAIGWARLPKVLVKP